MIVNKGVKITLIIFGITKIIGFSLRLLVNVNFWYSIAGNFIASFGGAIVGAAS